MEEAQELSVIMNPSNSGSITVTKQWPIKENVPHELHRKVNEGGV